MKRGITLLTLVITIIVMAILITTVTISGIGTLNNSRRMAFATEISMLQESVNAYYTRNNGGFPIDYSVQLDISGVTPNSVVQFDGEVITNNKVVLYKLDYELLGITSLRYGVYESGPEDIYVVSKDTKKVYYAKGVPIGNITYYTLTDDLHSVINYSTLDTVPLTRDGIVFIQSETNWTSEEVTSVVKVPKQYFSITVTANGSPVTLSSTDAVYNIYDITGISGNYGVIVSYAIDEEALITNTEFEVTNVDIASPNIVLDDTNQQLLVSDNPEETYAYFAILSKTDDLSGVKLIKYENERILDEHLSSYFTSNGKMVYKDIIPIEKYVSEITVYIEDNAGNWTAKFVTVDANVYTGLL